MNEAPHTDRPQQGASGGRIPVRAATGRAAGFVRLGLLVASAFTVFLLVLAPSLSRPERRLSDGATSTTGRTSRRRRPPATAVVTESEEAPEAEPAAAENTEQPQPDSAATESTTEPQTGPAETEGQEEPQPAPPATASEPVPEPEPAAVEDEVDPLVASLTPREYRAFRTWRSVKGTEMRAMFVAFQGRSVQLRSAEGKEFEIGITALSPADREWLKRLYSQLAGEAIEEINRLAADMQANRNRLRTKCYEFVSAYAFSEHVDKAQALLEQLGGWQVKVLSAEKKGYYSEGTYGNETTFSPGRGRSAGIVEVEFQALSASPGTPSQRLDPVRKILSADAIRYLEGNTLSGSGSKFGSEGRELLRKPCQLFLTMNARLELAGGESVLPQLTDAPSGYGWTLMPQSGGGSVSTFTMTYSDDDPTVLRFVRGGGMTAALVQPKRPVTLKLIYAVPSTTTSGTLYFCDCPPVAIRFGR